VSAEAPPTNGDVSDFGARAPTTDELLQPVLEALADGQTREIAEVAEMAANTLGLDPEVRALRVPSGALRIDHRVGWARTALVRAGLIDQPRESAMTLTDAGRKALDSAEGRINGAYLRTHCPAYASWIADMGGELPEDEVAARADPVVWMVRAGRGGVFAPSFVELQAIVVGWGRTGDVAGLDREAVREAIKASYSNMTGGQVSTCANAIFRVANTMLVGDVVFTPEPSTRTLLMGRIAGDYSYLEQPLGEDNRHSRAVEWFGRASRDELSYGAKNAVGSLLTLTRPSYEAELLRLADKHANDPSPEALPQKQGNKHVQQKAPDHVNIPSGLEIPKPTPRGDFQTVPRKLVQLLGQLDSGQLALPDFQRSFVWAPDATRELLVSIMRSFPAGALLFLQGGGSVFKPRAVEQAPDLMLQPGLLVLDGQQRLTSLYQAVYGVGQSRFFLDIGALISGADLNDAVRVFPTDRAAPLESLDVQAQALMMPLGDVRDGGPGRWRDKVVALRQDADPEFVRELLRGVEETYIDPLVQYAFPVTVLPPETELEAVCTIFETLNRTGKPLTPFELISARAFADGLSLYDYWNAALEAFPILSDYAIEPYYILQVISLRLGASCKRSTVLSLPAEDIAREWHNAIADMSAAVSLLRDECGVLGPKWLPYKPMLIPLASAWREIARSSGPETGAMRAKLKRWFWCAAFTGEYESSSATLAERDAPVLRSWLHDGAAPAVVESFTWGPQRWESVGTRQQGLYRATIALTLTQHPRDFHTGAPLTRDLIEAGHVDDHHVFPRGYLMEIGSGDGFDSVLNHTLIDSKTNVTIGKKAPSVYLGEIGAALGVGLDGVLSSHMLPSAEHSPLSEDDFEGFLAWRTERLAEALAERTGGAPAPPVPMLGPQLARLNARLEGVELALRELVVARLDDDRSRVPDHVMQRVDARIVSAARKTPGYERTRNGSLRELLAYFDLRELQEVIVGKRTWPAFEPIFATRESLEVRFSQAAELRNAIRHSRVVTDVAIKDGEAAILWFEQATRVARRHEPDATAPESVSEG
jgi:hypothetical protein